MNALDKIIKLMEEKNIEQQKFAEKIGVNKQVITDWKSGKSKSYMKYIDKISECLDVSIDYLLGTDDIANSKQYIFIKKLIDTTEKRILRWDKILSYDYNKKYISVDGGCSYPFDLDEYTKIKQKYEIIINQSFYASYKNGGYFITKYSNNQVIIYIYYINKFYQYCDNITLPLLDDLLMKVQTQLFGLENYIDEFIEDEFNEAEFHIDFEGLPHFNN